MDLAVGALHFVSIFEAPAALALWLIIVEAALEAGSIGVDPLALNHLALHKNANVLLASLLKDIGAFSVFGAFLPVAGVNILVLVSHDTLAVAAVVLPVAVVSADLAAVLITVDLLANAAFLAGSPLTLVGDRSLLVVAPGVVLKGAFAVSQLVKHIDCYNLCRKNLRQLSTSQCTCRH